MNEEIRVRIEDAKQVDLFRNFIKKFNNDFCKASDYLGITISSLSKYKRAVVRNLPKDVLLKVVSYLKKDTPQILFSGHLREIRKDYMKKAHSVLEQKYGERWAKELTNRRDFKGIHLSDFPDYIFVYLDEEYRKQLFNTAYNLFCSLGNLAKFLKVSPSRLSFWFYGKQKDYKRDVVGLQFIPLSKLKIISQKLVEDSREEFSMENIEKHVTMYRMQAGNPIKNPKFPIKEGPEIVRLLFHLLGDGYSGNKGDNANYRNTCKELLNEFKNDLKIFGDVPIYEQKFSIKFPRVFAEIIENYYDVNSRTFASRISDKIFQIPKKYLYLGIGAFADDEGTAYSSSIRLSSANYELLRGIKEIIDFLHLNPNEVRSQKSEKAKSGKMYYLEIKNIELYNKHIGFTHPKKMEILKFNIKRRKVHKAGYYQKNITNKKILELLKSKPMTIEQLSYTLNISRPSVDYHLRKLKDHIKIQKGINCRGKLLTFDTQQSKAQVI